jgi:hypothetical protein
MRQVINIKDGYRIYKLCLEKEGGERKEMWFLAKHFKAGLARIATSEVPAAVKVLASLKEKE